MLRQDNWVYIPPHEGPAMNVHTNTELGNSPDPQLYDLSTDIGQIRNTAAQHTGVVRAMSARLREIIDGEGTREAVPGTRG